MEYAPYASDADEAADARAEELEAAAAAVEEENMSDSDGGGGGEEDAYDDDYYSDEDDDHDVDEAALLAGAAALPGRRGGGAHAGGGATATIPAPTPPPQTNPLFPDGAAAAARVAAIEALPGGRVRAGGAGDAPYLAYKLSRRAAGGRAAGPGPSSAAATAADQPPSKRRRRGGATAASLTDAPADVFGVSAEEIFGADMLGGDSAPGARRRANKREKARAGRAARGARAKLPPPQARARMSDAHMAIVAGDFNKATALLKDAVRIAPNWPEPYETLGNVALQAGDSVRAMNFLFIAAHLHKGRLPGKVRAQKKAAAARAAARRQKEREAGIGGDDESEEEDDNDDDEEEEEDGRGGRGGAGAGGSSSDDGRPAHDGDNDDDDPAAASWRRLAKMSADHGMLRQAIYCLTKLLGRKRADEDAAWDRAVMYAQVGEHRAALGGFARLAKARPGDGDVIKWVARMHHALRDPASAAAALEGLLAHHPASVDLTHINMLAELRLSAGDAAGVAGLVARARRMVAEERGSEDEGGDGEEDREEPALPADLEVKAAAADAALGDGEAARRRLVRCVLGGEAAAAAASDLLEAAGGLLMQVGAPGDAVVAFQRALAGWGGGSEGAPPTPAALWDRLAAAAAASGGLDAESSALKGVLAEEGASPDTHAEAALRLAELAVRVGDLASARRLLGREGEEGGSDDEGEADVDGAALAAASALAGPAGAAGDRAARAADLLLDLGETGAFLAAAGPTAAATLDRAEAAAALRARLAPDVRKA